MRKPLKRRSWLRWCSSELDGRSTCLDWRSVPERLDFFVGQRAEQIHRRTRAKPLEWRKSDELCRCCTLAAKPRSARSLPWSRHHHKQPKSRNLACWLPTLQSTEVFLVSSGYSTDTTSLYRASLALHWLPARHIALCWLPALIIPLVWLPLALQRLPQLGSSSQELQIGSRIATPTPTPYTGSLHPVQGPNINTRSLRAS